MYAIIHITRAVRRALAYHERKVKQGVAEVIFAGNFLELPHELTRERQIARYENLEELNQKAETKTMLVTLSFHPADQQKLTKESLIEIARLYMAKIGFIEQPYLVFHHRDAAHPHLHIVSSLIRPDGSRINTHFIGARQSNPVRKELEERYGLVRGDKKEQAKVSLRSSAEKRTPPRRLEYGKSHYKPGISNVLDWVLAEYSMTNFRELNAILSEYRVIAIITRKDAGVRGHKGLVYKILDQEGKPIGIPVHASGLESKPTLRNIEKKFLANGQEREVALKRTRTRVAWTLASRKHSLQSFLEALRKENIALVKEADSFIYINHREKTVIEDKNLGEDYRLTTLTQKLVSEREVVFMQRKLSHGLRT
jgi:relaxase-like protein